MQSVNRTAVIVKPKQPFVDWLNSIPGEDSDSTLASVSEDNSTFLVPEFFGPVALINYLWMDKKRYCKLLPCCQYLMKKNFSSSSRARTYKRPDKAIYRLIKKGALHTKKISGRLRFDRAELDRVLANGDHKRGRGRPKA